MFSRIQFTALVATAVAYIVIGVRGQAASCDRYYTVQSGDTCDLISAAQNASTYQIATVNKAIIDPDCDNLFPGEIICLGLTGQDCTTVYVVKSGDSCATITTAAGITFATLRGNNPNVDANCDNIYPGEVLCTASSVL